MIDGGGWQNIAKAGLCAGHLPNFAKAFPLAELLTGLEILIYRSPYEPSDLYYWHREAKNSSAEVDYVIQQGKRIMPIEVKSGTSGKMQSMFLFMKEKKLDQGIRISAENFSRISNIDIYPLYAVANLMHAW